MVVSAERSLASLEEDAGAPDLLLFPEVTVPSKGLCHSHHGGSVRNCENHETRAVELTRKCNLCKAEARRMQVTGEEAAEALASARGSAVPSLRDGSRGTRAPLASRHVASVRFGRRSGRRDPRACRDVGKAASAWQRAFGIEAVRVLEFPWTFRTLRSVVLSAQEALRRHFLLRLHGPEC